MALFTCKVCDMSFATKDELDEHMFEAHNQEGDEVVGEEEASGDQGENESVD